jgi:AcrR family transcriptional regulator
VVAREHRRFGDRERTEAALEEAALMLVEREGVLAGLNLQRVADEAGVNRGLVYHYFGSRRDLLRRALRRYATDLLTRNIGEYSQRPLPERISYLLARMIKSHRIPTLILLLAIDGDRSFKLVRDEDETKQAFARDIEAGVIPSDLDVDALNVVLMSAVFAYAIRRRSFAAEFRTPVRELDRRVEDLLVRLVDGLRPVGEPRSRAAGDD